jgi:hypothetical protein
MSEEIIDSSEIEKVKSKSWKWVKTFEWLGFILLFLGVGFKYMHWAGADIMTLFAVLVLVLIYIGLFIPLIQAQNSTKGIVGFSVFAGLTLATTLIGILFKSFLWSGADNIASVGYVSVITGCIYLYIKSKGIAPHLSSAKAALRFIIFGFIAVGLFHVDARQLFDFNHSYRANDNLLDAFEDSYYHPSDSAIGDRYRRLRQQHFDSITHIDYPDSYAPSESE